ncbi:uncharacterized protein LOC110008511 [Amborella trichopoda]|nr:uncharacterized protein LOC110008511 [Amborella trichopoda]|eukprot:XP_020531883.1 uncharacterized protein LOC110008511 [Amborella trichopoda]
MRLKGCLLMRCGFLLISLLSCVETSVEMSCSSLLVSLVVLGLWFWVMVELEKSCRVVGVDERESVVIKSHCNKRILANSLNPKPGGHMAQDFIFPHFNPENAESMRCHGCTKARPLGVNSEITAILLTVIGLKNDFLVPKKENGLHGCSLSSCISRAGLYRLLLRVQVESERRGRTMLSGGSSAVPATENGEGNGSPKSHHPRILLVEDIELNRILVRKLLRDLNLQCEEAENGQVAVDLFKQGKQYDLVFMDKEMPVMDGHEATRQLRTLGVQTPIVALTGNNLPSDKESFLAAGVDEFRAKPLTKNELVLLLTQYGLVHSSSQ